MGHRKRLQRQLKKYLSDADLSNPAFAKFIEAVEDSYASYERDKELSRHAFSISELEYKEVNENLTKEYELKKLSIEKLKDALHNLDEDGSLRLKEDDDDLMGVLDYLNEQITKRKEIDDELKRLSLVASANPNGVLLTDAQGRIFWSNDGYERLTGYKAEELIGNRPTDTSSGKASDRKLIREMVSAYASGKSFALEIIYYRKDQTWFWALVKGQPILNEKGKVVQYFSIIEDITHTKSQAEQLKVLSLIAEENINGVVITDASGYVTWVNKSFVTMTGYELGEVMGKKPGQMLQGPETNRDTTHYLSRQIKEGKPFVCEIINYTKTKQKYWIRIQGQPIIGEHGLVEGFFALEENISIQKQQEEQIQRLSLVASANSKGVFILGSDRAIVWVNPAYLRITGYEESELLGSNPAVLFMNPETDASMLQRMIEKDKAAQNFTEEFIHNRKDGSTFWARLNMQFVVDTNGEVTNRFGVLEDITNEKDAENILRLREEKYRNIIANMNLGLIEVDNTDHIQFVNNSFTEMSGFEPDEAIGKKASDLFVSGENIDIVQQKSEKRKGGESDAYELPIRNKRGELKYWLVSGAPRFNDQGEVIGSIGIHLDITEQKKQELELIDARKKAEESSMAKEEFLANMSHEIRTPLNAIIGMLRELTKVVMEPKQQSFLRNADTASRHLLSIINNILDMSKIEAGEFQLDTCHFSLRDTINETVTIISNDASEKLLKVKVNISDKLQPALVGDPARIRQILINILGNAIKFTDKGYIKIHCDVTESNDYQQLISLTITDTGVGMDQQYLNDDNLFKKFSQEDKSTARKYGGTGLGMAISYELIQLMGGSVSVTSEKGKGTSVQLRFPLPIGDSNQIESSVVKYNFNALKGLRILLAEDNEMNRLVAINTLSYYGMDVTEAENGQIAVELLNAQQFDLVLMDLHMPIMDGMAATNIIRKQLNLNIPIIALTANAFKKEVDLCLAAGMNDYVTKPFEEHLLLLSILKQVTVATESTNIESHSGDLSKAKLYDLTKLIEASRGNDVFVHKMVKLFITQAELSINQLNQSFQTGDFKVVKEVAHRFKPSIDNMGIHSLKQEIRSIESMAAENPSAELLAQPIEHLSTVVNDVCVQLKHDFNTIF
jgi:PAS domain S-box-containing protein